MPVSSRPGERRFGPGGWWWLKVAASIALIANAVVAQLDQAGFEPLLALSPWPGSALVILAGGSNLWHFGLLRRDNPSIAEPRKLSRAGLYRVTRHPMYIGDGLIGLGFAWLAANAVALALLPVLAVGLWHQARVEEQQLAERFGDAYDEAWGDKR